MMIVWYKWKRRKKLSSAAGDINLKTIKEKCEQPNAERIIKHNNASYFRSNQPKKPSNTKSLKSYVCIVEEH